MGSGLDLRKRAAIICFTMKKNYSPEELANTEITLNLKAHIVRDLKEMEKFTKMPVDELATKALMMFIATHNDYLGKYNK
jgi:hypothetical protein